MGNHSFKNIFRKILLAFGCYLGIFEIVRIVLSKKEYVPILLYHRILDSIETKNRESLFSLFGVGISRLEFEKQVKYITNRYRVISLKEYIERKNTNQSLSGFAVITFDDGFRDIAIEILKRYNCCATIFIIEETLRRIYWRHELYLLLDYAQVNNFKLSLTPQAEEVFSLENSENKRIAACKILSFLGNMPENKREETISQIKEILRVKNEFIPSDLYFTQEDIKNLDKDIISFGAHSLTHRNLTALDYDEVLREIEDSQKIIEKLTGERKIPFSIPFGRLNDKIRAILKERGIMCNLIIEDSLNNKNEDIYQLKRIFVDSQPFPEFAYKISGTKMLFQRFIKLFYE